MKSTYSISGVFVSIICCQLTAAVPPVQKAETKERALTLAREIDIPLLRRADLAIVYFEPLKENIPPLRFEGAPKVLKLVDTLKPQKTDPVGLMPSCKIKFYCGKEYLRTVYLVGPIQWGFDRPEIFWPIGDASLIFEIINQARNDLVNKDVPPPKK